MNRCKHCGKEIDDRHTFCNSSCAAKYNNVHRGAFHWDKEKLERYKKRRRVKNDQERIAEGKESRYTEEGETKPGSCRYCGRPLSLGERTACKECQRYSKVQSLPARLGFVDGTPKERYEAAVSYLAELYLSGESTLTLSKKLNIPDETVWYNLKKAGLVRDLSESNKIAILQGRNSLTGSNAKYKHGWHRSWEGFEGYYRSSYELEYAQQLDEQKISYRIEFIPTFTVYWDSQKQCRRIAKPDFYLPDTNELIEIKSSWTYNEQNMKDKFKAYRDRGYKPRLILEGQEIQID